MSLTMVDSRHLRRAAHQLPYLSLLAIEQGFLAKIALSLSLWPYWPDRPEYNRLFCSHHTIDPADGLSPCDAKHNQRNQVN